MMRELGGWRARVDCMLLLLLLFLLNYYPEEKSFECLLLKQKSKNVPNKSERTSRCCFTLLEPVVPRS